MNPPRFAVLRNRLPCPRRWLYDALSSGPSKPGDWHRPAEG